MSSKSLPVINHPKQAPNFVEIDAVANLFRNGSSPNYLVHPDELLILVQVNKIEINETNVFRPKIKRELRT